MSQQKIYLVGAGITGWEGFGKKALEVIGKAEVLIGHKRHLDIFPDFSGKKLELEDLTFILEDLKNSNKRTVILGSGDPNFFGVARFLFRNFPKERIEIFPNVTSVQYAFARIKEPWDDAVFVSVHGRGLQQAIDRIVAAEKIAVLTDSVNTPARIAEELVKIGADGYEAWLCENMGLPNEKFSKTDVKGLLKVKASELNILILIKIWEPSIASYPLMGIDDEEFSAVKKLITKREVRAVTLAKLQLQNDIVMWDIGAGSGSVSIEAGNIISTGKIFAIEHSPQNIGFIKDNLKKFSPRNVKLIEGEATKIVDDLPDPDRIFIGGSGGMLEELIEIANKRLKLDGLVVLNAVTLDTLIKAVEFLEDHGFAVDVTSVNIARTKGATEYKLFEAQNPVYIITASRDRN
ncbi:MAG: precorrin-6y C5,15-methyltransferase (decarboxylating) subunit CbiE [Desulfuromonadales bacterium]|nr:precorrin-6y C5,15-methyltransferase (decarboxylating) subunit CbiE [Desulfuromonadales bacterium]